MNGLEQEFSALVEFRQIDANSAGGRAVFQSFGLRGHPAYVILNSKADVLWLGFGEQVKDILTQQILQALDG